MVSAVSRQFLAAAERGEPVYIHAVRAAFAGLPVAERFTLSVTLRGLDGAERAYQLAVPRFAAAPAPERRLAEELVLAELYNLLSTLGAQELNLAAEGAPAELDALARAFREEFGLDQSRRDRPGHGRCINVVERMIEGVSGAAEGAALRFTVGPRGPHQGAVAGRPVPPASERGEGGDARTGGGILAMCREAVEGLAGKAILGVDVGGTDIKLCLAVDGRAVRFVEFDWFPASFTRVDQLVDPILELVGQLRDEALRAGAAGLDAIGLCFPDVVVRDRIVGGEVYKTRGIRENPAIDYERELRRLTRLDDELRAYVRPGGAVGIVNDGPMAAFTAATERAAVDARAVEEGVFAHTLGTELGTGWVTEAGEIPDIPLEVYNCIIDLGSHPERQFPPDDARSLNNFNTRLPGTLQKTASQSGVFRLAAKYLPSGSPALYRELQERGFLVGDGGATGLTVPTAPRDLRKPFLEFLMQRAGDPTVARIFREIGEAMAVTWLETEFMLRPRARERVLFGRLVKNPACFALIVEGARAICPGIALSVADDELASTPLMKQIVPAGFTVAQFAQAVGAVHYGNLRLRQLSKERTCSPG